MPERPIITLRFSPFWPQYVITFHQTLVTIVPWRHVTIREEREGEKLNVTIGRSRNGREAYVSGSPVCRASAAGFLVYSILVCWRKLQGISNFQRLCEKCSRWPHSSDLSLPFLTAFCVVNGQFEVEFEWKCCVAAVHKVDRWRWMGEGASSPVPLSESPPIPCTMKRGKRGEKRELTQTESK